jgi:creatinine amidohydrolase
MRRLSIPFAAALVCACSPKPVVMATTNPTPSRSNQPLVEFEMMTWPEVKAAQAQGKLTALVYTGGTEQRGPQNVNGGHTLMARATVKAIALQLGNAIAMPVLPYTPNNASAALPGTIGLTNELLTAMLERISEQSIASGFKTIVLMGDHGGGQPTVYADVAKRLDEKYRPQGVRVYFCDQVYATANGDFDKFLTENHLPVSSHAGIPDTSEMMYLDSTDTWVRRALVATAVGDTTPRPPRSAAGAGGRDGAAGRSGAPGGTAAPRNPGNGISGDARPSTVALGKKIFDMKVEYAVRQIRAFQAMK